MKDRNWVAWMSTKFPLEIPATFGLEVYCPESAAAAAASGGRGENLCRRAEEIGYAGDLCSYVRMGMAMAQDPEGCGLPKPDVLLCCNNICGGMVPWYQAMARTLDVPLILLDFPYGQEGGEAVIAYLKDQLWTAVRTLEELTGKPWQEERFAQVCKQANRCAQAWQRLLDTAQSVPAPLASMEVFDYMPDMVTARCAEKTQRRLQTLAQALEGRAPSRREPGRYRIFWEGTPCWPVLGTVLPMLRERGIQVVADTISQSLGFRYRDLDGLAEAYCGTINGVTLERGVELRVALCRRYQVDGVLVHYNRSCRPWCGDLQEVERRLGRELGVPVVGFSADQGEAGAFVQAQFATRLDALVEQMEQRQGCKNAIPGNTQP